MSSFLPRFDVSELAGVGAGDTAGLIDVARDLESYGVVGWAGPTATFVDRVMAAVAQEAPPRLVASGGLVATIRQAWQMAWSGDRPLIVRGQAIALLLVLAIGLASVGSFAILAADRLIAPPNPPSPTVIATPSPTPTPTPTPSPSPARPQTATPSPTATETEHPSGTDDHSGSGPSAGSGGGGGSGGSGSDDGDEHSGGGAGTSRPTSEPNEGGEDDHTPSPT